LTQENKLLFLILSINEWVAICGRWFNHLYSLSSIWSCYALRKVWCIWFFSQAPLDQEGEGFELTH